MSAPSRDDFAATLDAANRIAQQWLSGLDERAAVAPPARPPALAARGIGEDAALALLRERIEPHLSASPGPRYWGFVTGGATPAALAGDWLASAYDQNASHDGGSIAAAVERDAIAGLRALLGLSDAHSGWFTSGATQSNTSALAAARQALLARRGHDASELGLTGAPRLRVLAGAAHASIGKALSILGIGRRALEPVATLAGRTAVDVAALESALAASDAPTIVVASAGEVNTGDCDDVAAIAALCRAHGAWLHVDGAFGLFAALDPAHAAKLGGVDAADSVTVDLHKWLNVPYDAAIVLTRHAPALRSVFRSAAAYLGESDDPLHHVPENSRRFRALPAWLTLAAYGRDGIAEWIVRNNALAQRLGDGIARLPAFELLDAVRLNIVCFALREGDAASRDALLARLARDGRVFLTPTVLRGRPAIRAALVNWRTSQGDVEIALQALAEATRT